MSVENIEFEFLDIQSLKDLLKITDTKDDALLRNTIGIKAESWIKNRLIPFVDSFPLDDVEKDLASSAALSYAAAQYKKKNNNRESAKTYLEDAKEDLDTLILSLKAKPTSRTRPVAASLDYDTESELFSQRLF